MNMFFLLLLSLSGLADALYLTWEHYAKVIPPCTVNHYLLILSDCGKVLQSSYAIVYGIPVALIGVFYYSVLTTALMFTLFSTKKIIRYFIVLQTIAGTIGSLYFMFLQFFIIKSICIYCTLSALICFAIVAISYYFFKKDRYLLHLSIYAFIYQRILKPIYFLIDPEIIHERMVFFGNLLAHTPLIRLIGTKFVYKEKSIQQKINGINFENPIGLAAGFDYDANLTQALYYLDFGFQSVGTVTNRPFEGNPRPRLGRLPKSRSLMVNKGFKNKGAEIIANNLKGLDFKIPVGISIGVTNNKLISTIEEAIKDIISAFKIFEKAGVKNSYYELNISCPNLANAKTVDFYSPKNLGLLLKSVDRLNLKKPIFIKMPIEKTNRDVLAMLKIIDLHKSITGLIFGNLQKDKNNPSLFKDEVKKFKVGNFSGKPCEVRSNELIKLTYKKYKDRFTIIGCGGVFSAADAYKKIKLGASLVQLITGMIFQGPQLISQINLELIDLIKQDGFRNIKDAVGRGI